MTAIEKGSVGAAVVSVFATLVVLAAPRPQFHGADGQPLTYFLAEGNPTSGYQPSDCELALWAIETWARASDGALELQASAERDAVVRLYWAPAKDGQLGEMRPLRVKGRPGAAVYVRPDLDALGPKIAGRAQQDSLWRDAIVVLGVPARARTRARAHPHERRARHHVFLRIRRQSRRLLRTISRAADDASRYPDRVRRLPLGR